MRFLPGVPRSRKLIVGELIVGELIVGELIVGELIVGELIVDGTRTGSGFRIYQLSSINSPILSIFSGRVSPTSRGAPLRTGRLRVQILHAAPIFPVQRGGCFWNVNRTSEPDLFAKQWAPLRGECGASPRHSAIIWFCT